MMPSLSPVVGFMGAQASHEGSVGLRCLEVVDDVDGSSEEVAMPPWAGGEVEGEHCAAPTRAGRHLRRSFRAASQSLDRTRDDSMKTPISARIGCAHQSVVIKVVRHCRGRARPWHFVRSTRDHTDGGFWRLPSLGACTGALGAPRPAGHRLWHLPKIQGVAVHVPNARPGEAVRGGSNDRSVNDNSPLRERREHLFNRTLDYEANLDRAAAARSRAAGPSRMQPDHEILASSDLSPVAPRSHAEGQTQRLSVEEHCRVEVPDVEGGVAADDRNGVCHAPKCRSRVAINLLQAVAEFLDTRWAHRGARGEEERGTP